MMEPGRNIISIIHRFERHGRQYCLFSLDRNQSEFLYFSHRDKDLRSLFYGTGFAGEIPRIVQENPDLCIECGLGTRIKGGVSLDGGDLVAWRCSVDAANRILAMLAERCGDVGTWIRPFPDTGQE